MELPPSSEISWSVLISPGVSVLIERVPIPGDAPDAVDSDVEEPSAGDSTYQVAGARSIRGRGFRCNHLTVVCDTNGQP